MLLATISQRWRLSHHTSETSKLFENTDQLYRAITCREKRKYELSKLSSYLRKKKQESKIVFFQN